MMAVSHVIFGAVGWAFVSHFSGYPTPSPLDLSAAAFGALLPDIDHPQSAVGRKLSPISIPLSALVGHRGVTHSLFAVGIAAITLYFWGGVSLVAPVIVGYLSHLLADSLTLSGVPLLWPNRRPYGIPLCRTGDWREMGLTGLVALLGVALVGFHLDEKDLRALVNLKGFL